MLDRLKNLPLGEKLAAGFALLTAGAAVYLTSGDLPATPAGTPNDTDAMGALGGPMRDIGAREPSGLRESAPGGPRCSTCKFYRVRTARKKGHCKRFRWFVQPSFVCNVWRARS